MPTIDILANSRQAQREVKDLSLALDDVGDALDDVAKDSTKSADKVEAGFRDMQRASSKNADGARDDARKIERALTGAYKDSAKVAEKSSRDMGDTVGEFKDEAISNFSEVASSFQGDMTSVADGVQGILGGLGGSLGGPLGIALGLAGAAFGAFTATSIAESEAMKEAVSTNFQEMAAEGVDAWASAESQVRRLSQAYDEHEQEIESISDVLGLTFETVAQAWAGNEEAIQRVRAAEEEYKAGLEAQTGAQTRHNEILNAKKRAMEETLTPLNDVLGGYDKAREKAESFDIAQSAVWKKAVRDSGVAADAVDRFGNSLYTLPDGQQVVIDAETGVAHQDVSRFKGDVNTIPKTVNTTVKVGVDASGWNSWYNNRPQVMSAEVRVMTNYGRSIP